ncbi:MAG: hypothetical protein AB8G99_26865 [Planctomycetaceae bacterium]
MTVDELLASATTDSVPPDGLSPEAEALWHTKAGNWDAAHDIAQDIHTAMGSWIHAHLHVIEGDIGNGRYWYGNANRPAKGLDDLDSEWRDIAAEVLGEH